MSRLSKIAQNIFASTASAGQIGKFGSFAATGTGVTTTDPAVAQALSQWLAGWFSAVIDGADPCIEDMNAIGFVTTYQLAYLMQMGLAEWDAATTYYIGSLVNDGTGNIYISRTDSNLNNAVSSATNWTLVGGPIMSNLGDMIYGGTNGAQTALSGNTTTTPSFLTQVGTGAASAAPIWRDLLSPTIQKILTPSSGTYTTPAGVLYIEVELIGGGGGGGGSATTGTGGTGGTGGTSSFGTTLLSATGGVGGNAPVISGGQAAGGSGGTASLGSGPIGIVIAGGTGSNGISTTTIPICGGTGAASTFGGAGRGTGSSAGVDGAANSGAGGGGAGVGSATAIGAGGGSGGYLKAIIKNPSATYPYVCGAAGAAGTAGTGGNIGGKGGTGLLKITEHYQ